MLTIKRDPEATEARLVRDLEAVKAAEVSRINAQIGQARAAHITLSPGQDMIYARKEAEARAFLALEAEPKDLNAFPFMSAEVGLTAPSAFELAQIWANMAAMLTGLAADLERQRMTAIAAVQACTTPDEVAVLRQISGLSDR